MENINKKRLLLSKPIWTYKDIKEYDPNIKSSTTAIAIKKKAIEKYNGSVSYGTQYVKSDSVLKVFGTTREKEIELIGKIINEEELQKGDL